MDSIEIKAPAKINLFLRILGKRPDGFHELESLTVPVALFDSVRIEGRNRGSRGSWPGRPELDGPANLAHAAARAWSKRARAAGFGVNVQIKKRIPIRAGLGGGSSDAAATLRGLQKIGCDPLSNDELHEIATSLGADVPFFLQDGPCLARGIGHLLTPVRTLPCFWLILACAPFGHETRLVFENLKYPLTSVRSGATLDRPDWDDCPDWGIDRLAAVLVNDLQPTGERMHPEIKRVRQELMQAGAVGALMSGSGPSVFGLFSTRRAARQALRRLRKIQGWTYLVLRAIN